MTPGSLQVAVRDWYATNGRDLAFRQTSDPWAVLVSEVMAQQTQAERAATAWAGFMARFPTPAALAAASPAEVIRAWRGLGYNRRALALNRAAAQIVADHDGRVPDSLEALERLPGIGPYTARAVLAIAFGRPVAALDTNVRRVLDRAFGGLPASPRERQRYADGLVPAAHPADWTHALMDIGATLCRARDVRCEACPLATQCRFAIEGGREGSSAASTRPGRPTASRPPPARFEATTRWLRGRILDRLRDAPEPGWLTFDEPIGQHDAGRVRAALGRLALEAMVEVRRESPTIARLPR